MMYKDMRSALSRIAVVLLGIAAAFCIIEAGLRITGYAYRLQESNLPLPAKRPGEIRILCIGDSFVEGMASGNIMQRGFPAQMEELFSQNGLADRVTVINTGKAGENICQIREKLAGDIDRFHPDLVVFLGGLLQDGNYYGYYRYRSPGHPLAFLADQMNRSSALRLFHYLQTDLRHKRDLRCREELSHFERRFLSSEGQRHSVLGYLSLKKGETARAAEELRLALKKEPECLAGQRALAEITGDPHEALDAFEYVAARHILSNAMYERMGKTVYAAWRLQAGLRKLRTRHDNFVV